MLLATLRRVQSAAIRQVYAQGGVDPATGKRPSEAAQRAAVNARWQASGVGSMVLQNAVRAGRALRSARPEGDIVFGGRKQLERRAKGLISAEEWKTRRLRPLELQGHINKGGNYHIAWPDTDPDSPVSTLELRFPYRAPGTTPAEPGKLTETRIPIKLHTGTLSRKQQALLADVFRCARRNDLTLMIRVDADRIAFTYDPLDLRTLLPGQPLVEARAADVTAGKAPRKGRARTETFRATKVAPYGDKGRPTHPHLKSPTQFHARRRLGIDLNPEWIGFTVLEYHPKRGAYDDLAAYTVLDYRLLRWDLDHFDLRTRNGRAQAISIAAQRTISFARAWNVGELVLEDKLGLLSTRCHNKATNRKNNTWSRSSFRGPLEHRARMVGITVKLVNAAYSTTIGNVVFGALWDARRCPVSLAPDATTPQHPGLPDACAAAAEIARRGFVPTTVLVAARERDRQARASKKVLPISGERMPLPPVAKRWKKRSAAFLQQQKCQKKQQHLPYHPSRDRQTVLSAWTQAWLPRFDMYLLQHDRWKETAAGSSNWVDAHGTIKMAKGLRRPHVQGFIPATARSVDARPVLDGHEVAALGYITRPGWWIRPSPAIDNRGGPQGRPTLSYCQHALVS